MDDAKFISEQFKGTYGRADAIEILEKQAELYEKQSIAVKNRAVLYQNAANILKLEN